MSEILIDLLPEQKDREEENKQIDLSDTDLLQFISDCDPDGIPWAWHDVRKKLCEFGVKALHDVFNYYEEHNHFFDSWTNYMLACSHFDKEELNGKNNHQFRKHLEWKVKRLMKKQSEKPSQHIYETMRQNRRDL